MDMVNIDIKILRNQLTGANLKDLLKKKKMKKYSVAKACGLTYQTLLNWEKERFKPADDSILVVARYLGLIKPGEAEKLELQKDIEKINEKFKRLEND